MEKKYTNNRI